MILSNSTSFPSFSFNTHRNWIKAGPAVNWQFIHYYLKYIQMSESLSVK